MSGTPAQPPARPPAANPWFWALIVAGGVFAASLFFLATVLLALGDDSSSAAAPSQETSGGDETPAPGDPTPTERPGGDDRAIRYEGAPPERLLLESFRPASPGEDVDLRFGAGETEVAAAYWVPVVANHVGVYELTTAQLTGLIDGTITDWSEVGGLPGPVRYLAVEGQPGGMARLLVPNPPPGERYATVENLLAAMTPSSGAFAFIPLDALGVEVTALGVDGIDIARGFGDASQWPFVERITVEALTNRGEAAVAALQSLRAEPPEVTRVVATGDYLPVRCSLQRIEATGDWTSPFQTTLGDFLREADLALSSQDGSIQDFSEPLRCVETVNLTSPPGAVDALVYAGIDGVTVAANHIFDCGEVVFCGSDAFERTLELLHEAGIKTAGGGLDLDEALTPATWEINGLTIGLLAFDDIAAGPPSWLAAGPDTPGTAPMDDDYSDEEPLGYAAFYAPPEMLGVENLTRRIAEVKQEVDFLIVMFNSGTEDTHDPSPRSIKALRAAAEAGADLIIGNQAHHVQAAEVHNGVFVAYALGNFIYDQVHTPQHSQCYLVEAAIWPDRVATTRLLPCEIEEQYRPVFAEGETRASILGDIFSAAERLPAAE